MATSIDAAALPYHEPDIVTILILASFLLSLNIIDHVLDRLIYCGLLGQIFLGILWGTPGAKWLHQSAEEFIVNIGYLGLILLVYEGGLSTSFKSLKANLFLSSGIALTGICLPIAFSYVLLSLANATPLQAFAAGAALCSTSLGTTFTVLGTSGLITTRMGVLLATAAMMDDVVGLVMVQVISNLGSSSSNFEATTVVRPTFVSLGFAIVVPLTARLIVQPLTMWVNAKRSRSASQPLKSILSSSKFALIVHSLILIALVTASSYAGTSNLFAAYLAGASISWWDSEVEHPQSDTSDSTPPGEDVHYDTTSGEGVFTQYYQPALNRILRPLFFASIGFSIPITQMFSGTIVWKGIVYTLLMIVSKILCGAWLVKMSLPWSKWLSKVTLKQSQPTQHTTQPGENGKIRGAEKPDGVGASRPNQIDDRDGINSTSRHQSHQQATSNASNISRRITAKTSIEHPHNVTATSKPLSLYPAAIVGSAMTARGEIGFLISALAESNGIFRRQQSGPMESYEQDEIFLIVTWAIVLCTILGPITVGMLVKRMRRLENNAHVNGRSRSDVLGVWN